jgi:Cu+-exporting ATPase
VQLRAQGDLPAADAGGAPRHEEIDPVCGMTVDVTNARHRTTYEGRTYYFCSPGCLASFEADPDRYAVSATKTGQ